MKTSPYRYAFVGLLFSLSLGGFSQQSTLDAKTLQETDPMIGHWQLDEKRSGMKEAAFGNAEVTIEGTLLYLAAGSEPSAMYLYYSEDEGLACPQEFTLQCTGQTIYGKIKSHCAVMLDKSDKPVSFNYEYHPVEDYLVLETVDGGKAYFVRTEWMAKP